MKSNLHVAAVRVQLVRKAAVRVQLVRKTPVVTA